MLPTEDPSDESKKVRVVDSASYGTISMSKIPDEDTRLRPVIESDTVNLPPLKCKDWWLLFSLCYAQFCLAACVSLQAPFFPKEAGLKGASATVYGLVFGVFELVIIIASPIYGKLVKWVAPSFMVTAGIFLAGASCVIFGFLNRAPYGTPFITLAFVVRIVEGLGCAAVITASFTIVAGEFPTRIAKTFSALETSFGIGLIAGPTIGGVLYDAKGYTLPFMVMGTLMLMGSILACFVIPESKPPPLHSGNLFKYVGDFGVILDGLSLVTSLTFIGFNSATLEPHIRQFNISPSLIGFIFIITGSIYGITTPIWGWLCDKGIRLEFLIIVGYLLQCVNLVFIGPAPYLPINTQLWLVIVSLVIGGIGIAAKVVCTFIHALRSSIDRGFPNDVTTHAMVSAMFSSCNSLGAFIGPTFGGVMLDTLGYRKGTQMLLVMEGGVMLLTIIYFVYKPETIKPLPIALATQEAMLYKTEAIGRLIRFGNKTEKIGESISDNDIEPLLSIKP